MRPEYREVSIGRGSEGLDSQCVKPSHKTRPAGDSVSEIEPRISCNSRYRVRLCMHRLCIARQALTGTICSHSYRSLNRTSHISSIIFVQPEANCYCWISFASARGRGFPLYIIDSHISLLHSHILEHLDIRLVHYHAAEGSKRTILDLLPWTGRSSGSSALDACSPDDVKTHTQPQPDGHLV